MGQVLGPIWIRDRFGACLASLFEVVILGLGPFFWPYSTKTVTNSTEILFCNSSVLEFKESNPPNQTNEPTKKESNRKKKNRIKMSRKFPFMKSIEDVSKIDNLNGSHSASLNQYKVSFTEILLKPDPNLAPITLPEQGPPKDCSDFFDGVFISVWYELLGVRTVRSI